MLQKNINRKMSKILSPPNTAKIASLLIIVKISMCNYVTNGEFELPYTSFGWIDMDTAPSELCTGWIGHYQLIGSTYIYSMGSSQNVEMTPYTVDKTGYTHGYMEQNLTLDLDGYYNVSYKWAILGTSTPDSYFQMTTYWNGLEADVLNPTNKANIQTRLFQVEAYTGVNVLKFNSTKYANIPQGFNMDSISVVYDRPFPPVNTTNTTNSTKSTSANQTTTNQTANSTSSNTTDENATTNETSSINNTEATNQTQNPFLKNTVLVNFLKSSSLPRNVNGVKSVMFVVDDLWLYVYDKRNYSSLMNNIFETVQKIESFKWTLFNYQSAIPDFRSKICKSNYTSFTNEKYKEVEDLDGSFFRSVTIFSLLTIPQTLALCLILKCIFELIRGHKISVFLRRYSFFLPNFLQIVLEPNISYFTYLFFNQAKIFFSFRFSDKIFLTFAVVFEFCVIMFSICFYYYINQSYEKKCGYFLNSYYRFSKGLLFATIRINIRALLYGALHSLLFEKYVALMISLTCIEFILLLYTFYMEMRDKVYFTRLHFMLGMFYHVVFILLNLSLLYEYSLPMEGEAKQLCLQIQNFVLYILGVLICITVVLDFIPIQYFRIVELTVEEELNQDCQVEIKGQEKVDENFPKFVFPEFIGPQNNEEAQNMKKEKKQNKKRELKAETEEERRKENTRKKAEPEQKMVKMNQNFMKEKTMKPKKR